jgi:hypothetical protein
MRVKLPIQKIRPEQVATPRVGIGQERLIGRAVIIWARLEASLHDLIWTIEGKGLAEGRGETEKHMVGRLLKELRKIGSGSTETALEVRMAVLAVAGAVKTLSEDRNLIVHGTWGELDGVPTVGSLQAGDDRPQRGHHGELPTRSVARFHSRRDSLPRPSDGNHCSG